MALEFIVVSVRARAMTCSAFSFTELSVLNGPWPSAVGMNLPISQAPCTKLGCREFGPTHPRTHEGGALPHDGRGKFI